MEKEKLRANIWKLNFMRVARSFMVTMPVVVLFLQEKGLSMKEILILQAAFSVAVLVLEVPSGYFSDRFGRKNSIVLGWVLVFWGFVGYALACEFWGFLLAELILGLGCSFISGADSALLYDTLLELKRERDYKKVEGRNCSIGLMSEGVASVVGGFLALISLSTPIYCEAIIVLCAFPIILSLYEPSRRKIDKQEGGVREMVKILKYSFRGQARLKWAIFYSSVAATATMVMVWFIQPYLKINGVELKFFGIIWASLMFVSAFSAWNVQRAEDLFGRKMVLASMLILPVLGYFLLGSIWSVWSGIFISLFYFARGINRPIINDMLQNIISSEIRATVLSVKNMVERLMFSFLGPIVGWVNDAFSLKTALLTSGAIFFLLGIIVMILLFFSRLLVSRK